MRWSNFAKFALVLLVTVIWGMNSGPVKALPDNITVTTSMFEVTFEHATYTIVDPLQSQPIWARVKNTSSLPDRIDFFRVENGVEYNAGYIYLEPGKTAEHKVVSEYHQVGTGSSTHNYKIVSSRDPTAVAYASVTIETFQIDLQELPAKDFTINVYDAVTHEPIEDALVYYRYSPESRAEPATALGDGRFVFKVLDFSEPATRYGIPWPGYTLEVKAAGYRTYWETDLKPDGNVLRNVYLIPLAEIANFQSVWMENLEYPGVWRVIPSEDWGYIAVGLGKHPDPWDVPVSTRVHLFRITGEQLWSYPVGDQVWGIDLSRDGSIVAFGSFDGMLYVINRAGTLLWSENAHTQLREVKLSDSYLGAETVPVKMYNLETGEVVWECDPGVDTWWRGITFSPDEKYVFYGGGNSLIMFDLENGTQVWHRYIANLPYDIKITPNLSKIVVADKGSVLWCYDAQGNLLWHERDIPVLTDMDMSRDGSRIVTLSHNGTVRMYDGNGTLLWKLTLGSGGHNGLDMTSDGRYVVVGGGVTSAGGSRAFPYAVYLLDNEGNLLWEHSQDGPIPQPYHPYLISVMSVAISDNGSYIVAGYGAGNPGIRLFSGSISGDSDGDMLPDTWETRYGLNPNDPSDATQDQDGDGYTNLQEYRAGTDPTLASSHPPAQGENVTGGETTPTETNWAFACIVMVIVILLAVIAVKKR